MQKSWGLYDPSTESDACGIGLVCNVSGEASRFIVTDAVDILKRLEHRGAVGGDSKTGDGAGMLLRIPHAFFADRVDFSLPEPGMYGLGFLFLPKEPSAMERALDIFKGVLESEGGTLLGFRTVPVDPSCLGLLAREQMPSFRQAFVTFPSLAGEDLERRLFVLRRSVENRALAEGFDPDDFYICSLSSQTVVYKGMFVSPQFMPFYHDLSEEDFTSPVAIVHQRYSTNTFPSWRLAQPFRLIAHNGEINTLRRNMNNMRARESSLKSELFGDDLPKLFPIVNENASDSAIFDNVLELLTRGGRSILHSVMMMIPEAFGTRYHISEDKRAFFEYHSAIMEPWDGPAAVAFTDGKVAGAMLDRNGLRPARYFITRQGTLVLSSEAGVLDLPPEDILEKGRLGPGSIIAVDFAKKRVLKDHEVKSSVSRRKQYRHWLEQNRIQLKGLFGVPRILSVRKEKLPTLQKAFGYTREDIRKLIIPMVENGQEPVGSMGNDTPPAVLSTKSELLYNYFRQIFAQVTNPPIDPYRENLVMSLMSFVGRERNLLAETPEHCRQLKLSQPILTNDDLDILRNSGLEDFSVSTVPILFTPSEDSPAMEAALEQACRETEAKIDEGASLIILSDRGTDAGTAAIPALLAVSGVHHYLVRRGKRHLAGIVIETGEAREVHHFATLIGFGASGINPYLVFETIKDLKDRGELSEGLTDQAAVDNYIEAVKKGLLKIMSKMGISTLRSYRGAQLFEAIGLDNAFIDRYFAGTRSRIGGIGIDILERDKFAMHKSAFSEDDEATGYATINSGGIYSYRRTEASHYFSPETIALLQKSTREGNYDIYRRYSAAIQDTSRGHCTLRSLLRIKKGNPIPLEEVEPEEEILKRFCSSAMSFGSISPEAHTTLAEAMNSIGQRSNSGEGGESEDRFSPGPDGRDRNSKIKQIASGRFGVTSSYLVHARELQIKMAQGAKPGEGGQLPGHKVNDEIASVRHSTPGVTLISPPPHHDIYSIEDLAQLIHDLKRGNPEARVSVKLVSQLGVGTVAAGVAKARADTVVISGGDGGTGAAPLSSIMYAGSPWELGLAETQQVLVRGGLREKIRVQVDGQLKTGRDIVVAALLGAEEFGFATTALVTMGCVMARKCHNNTCPVGVATQDPELRKRFRGKSEWVVNFMRFLAREVRELMAEIGFRTFDEMVGRTEFLEVDPEERNAKTAGIDFSAILAGAEIPEGISRVSTSGPDPFPPCLDDYLIDSAKAAIESGERVAFDVPIANTDRSVGASLSAAISKRFGSRGLTEDTVTVNFTGSAGQSFGAFLAPGVTFILEGEVNDYVGKSLSGGRIVIRPPKQAVFTPAENIIAGNVSLFGATSGEVFICGRAGERFAVRNSGAIAVVEGVGDHACEYMTGGRVVVLGETGINFAAGMSGGIAYVLDKNRLFDTRCNLEMVDVEALSTKEDIDFLRYYLEMHRDLTGSGTSAKILDQWEETLPIFVRVIPIEYRRLMEAKRTEAAGEAVSKEIKDRI